MNPFITDVARAHRAEMLRRSQRRATGRAARASLKTHHTSRYTNRDTTEEI